MPLGAGLRPLLAGGLRRHVRPSGGPVLHLGALTGMTLSARLAFPLVPRLRFFTLLLVLAVVLEVAQSVVQPSRDFSYLDILANLCGVGLGALGWRFWRGSPWERRSRRD